MTASNSASDRKGLDRQLVLNWLLATLLAVLLTLVVGDRMRRGIFDSWQTAEPRDLSATDVRVVLIDDDSVEALGPWQWPRYYLARLTEELAARDAKVIAFDIVFPEYDRVRPDTFVGLYPELSDQAASEVKALRPMDELFGQVIGQAPVVLGHAGVSAAPIGQAPVADAPITGQLPPNIDSWPAELAAIPELDQVALGTGLINVRPDADGAHRSVPLVMRAGGKARLGFATEIARNAIGAESVALSGSSLRIGGREVPLDRHGRMRLHFGHFPREHMISASDVLGQSTRIPRDEFAGKAVLIGVLAEGTSDITATPLSAEEYGPLVQAQAVDAILRGGWLERPAWAGWAEWATAALFALFALASARLEKWFQFFVGAMFIATPAVSWLAFSKAALLLDPARPLVVGIGAVAGVATGLFARARVDRQRLRDALVQEQIAAAAAESELEVARAIQLGMVPPRDRLRTLDPRVDVDALLEPARSVGGDFYDAVKIGTDRIGFVTADVAGKGVPAALYMAMSKALTSAALSRMSVSPVDLAETINSELLKDNREAMSVAMLIGILDLDTGDVQMISAGHEDPLLLSPGGALERVALEGGPPFGVTDFPYPIENMVLKRGETLVLVTDGVTEAQDPQGRLFGRDRALATGNPGPAGAGEICESIRDQVRAFEDGEEATDDLTVMAVRLL